MFAFFLLNAVPVSAAVWYFRQQKEELVQNMVRSLPSVSADVIRESMRVMRSAPHPMLVFGERASVFRIDPHPPGSVVLLPNVTDDKNAIDNALSDLFTTDANDAIPLRAIHFCMSKASFGTIREATSHALVYTSPSRQGYVTLRGKVAAIEDASLRERLWKRHWHSLVAPFDGEPHQNPDYVLVRMVPDEVRFQSMAVQWDASTVRRDADGWVMA